MKTLSIMRAHTPGSATTRGFLPGHCTFSPEYNPAHARKIGYLFKTDTFS